VLRRQGAQRADKKVADKSCLQVSASKTSSISVPNVWTRLFIFMYASGAHVVDSRMAAVVFAATSMFLR